MVDYIPECHTDIEEVTIGEIDFGINRLGLKSLGKCKIDVYPINESNWILGLDAR